MIIQMIATIKRSSGSASSSKFINQHSDCSHGVAVLSNFLQHNIWTPIKPNRTNKSTRRSTHTKRKRKKIMCKLIAASCRCLGSMNQRRELGTTRNRSHPNGLAFQASSRPRNHPPPPPRIQPPQKKTLKTAKASTDLARGGELRGRAALHYRDHEDEADDESLVDGLRVVEEVAVDVHERDDGGRRGAHQRRRRVPRRRPVHRGRDEPPARSLPAPTHGSE